MTIEKKIHAVTNFKISFAQIYTKYFITLWYKSIYVIDLYFV